MKLKIIPVTPFEQNCSVVFCESTMRGALIDPGGDIEVLRNTIDSMEIKIEKILLTHGHIDHCGASAELKEILDIPIEGPHVDDQFWIDQLPEQGRQFGFPILKRFVPDRYLDEDDEVSFGDIRMKVKHCPGHTPGHVIFHEENERLAFVGDVLFRGSIGRTDFPRGDFSTLINSITTKLWPLGNDVTFIPGHGPTSTFGEERLSNPYVSDGIINVR
ncbi:MAG: MBL fold metallo-hydrolase [Betaproteobacteria bacterium]|jgi:hydroxyacylglutathione hydrolase